MTNDGPKCPVCGTLLDDLMGCLAEVRGKHMLIERDAYKARAETAEAKLAERETQDDFERGCFESMKHNAERMREHGRRANHRIAELEASLARREAQLEKLDPRIQTIGTKYTDPQEKARQLADELKRMRAAVLAWARDAVPDPYLAELIDAVKERP